MPFFDKLKGKSKSKRRDSSSLSDDSSSDSDSDFERNKKKAGPNGFPVEKGLPHSGGAAGYPNNGNGGFAAAADIGPPPFPPPQFQPPPIDHQQAARDFAAAENGAPPPGAPPQYSLQADPGLSLGGPPRGPPPGFGGPGGAAMNYHPPGYAAPPQSIFEPLFSHAPDQDRDWGDAFTNAYMIYPPRLIQPFEHQAIDAGNVVLVTPPQLEFPFKKDSPFAGKIEQRAGSGLAVVRSKRKCKDTTFVSSLPFYSPHINHLAQGQGFAANRRSLYFEIRILALKQLETASVAIGWCCLPYPWFRLPGWHRGSVAVHSDDGRRYVNDSLSGKDFTHPFRQGDTVGLGLNLERMVCYLTRNGRFDREWSLISDKQPNGRGVDPERNFRDGGIEGLEGDRDIYGAVGVFGKLEVEVNWTGRSKAFMYRG